MTIDITEEPPSDWNSFLIKEGLGITQQTKEIAEYSQKWLDWKPLFLRILDPKGNITLQNLLFEYLPDSKLPKKLVTLVKKFKNNLRWQFGPISKSSNAIIEFFEYVKKTNKTIYGKNHPLYEIPKLNFEYKPWTTFLIDLTKNKDELYKNMNKHSAQKNIERSISRGVVIEPITEKNLEEYTNLLFSTKSHTPNFEESFDFWRIMKPTGFSGFLARKNNDILGGMLFSFFNKYVYEWGVARSEIDFINKYYSQDLIKWKIIEWGIHNKMSWYDLAGANPNPNSNKEKGILRYKKKWGGLEKPYWIINN